MSLKLKPNLPNGLRTLDRSNHADSVSVNSHSASQEIRYLQQNLKLVLNAMKINSRVLAANTNFIHAHLTPMLTGAETTSIRP